jgi:hypothetical protein
LLHFAGHSIQAGVDPVPQKHPLKLLETENPQKCGFSRYFLVGRPGLEPGTLCLKDSGAVIDCAYVFQTVHFPECFRTQPSNMMIASTHC